MPSGLVFSPETRTLAHACLLRASYLRRSFWDDSVMRCCPWLQWRHGLRGAFDDLVHAVRPELVEGRIPRSWFDKLTTNGM